MPMAPGQPLFLVLWAAVNRTTTSDRVAGPDQRLSVEQALRAVTIDAAYSLEMETEVGSIEPGKPGNFTILDADPFEVAPEAIKDIKVLATVSEGAGLPRPATAREKGSTRCALPRGGSLALHRACIFQSDCRARHGTGLRLLPAGSVRDLPADDLIGRLLLDQCTRLVGRRTLVGAPVGPGLIRWMQRIG